MSPSLRLRQVAVLRSASQPQGVLQGGEQKRTPGQVAGNGSTGGRQPVVGAAGCVVHLQRLSPGWEHSLATGKHALKGRGGDERGWRGGVYPAVFRGKPPAWHMS